MLRLEIEGSEAYVESTNTFVPIPPRTLILEHSLMSIAKWESKWHKPFLMKNNKTAAEMLDYIRCMTVNDVDPVVYNLLREEHFEKIHNYMEDPMTATTVNEDPNQPRGREIITAELIYYMMFALNIPLECQKWHFNRLMMLIKVCQIKNTPPKKMSKRDALNRIAALNKARRKHH